MNPYLPPNAPYAQPPPQGYRDGMGPVVSAELGEYIRDVALDCVLRNGKLAGNRFVRVPGCDQPEHGNLAWGQIVLGGMLSQLGGNLRWDSPLAGMDSTDGVQEFFAHVSLQYVTLGTRFKSPQHLDIACVCRQHDDSGVWEFAANADDCLDSAQSGHLEIH